MEQSEQIDLLLTAVNEMQKERLFALKDSANPFFKSRYADLSSCWEAGRDPLTKNGLSVIQMTDYDDQGRPVIVTTLGHKSGQWMRGRLLMIPAKDDPQGVGSAITYGRRYALCGALGICPDDDDGEMAMNRNQAPQPKPSKNNAPKQTAQQGGERHQPKAMMPEDWKIVGSNLAAYGMSKPDIDAIIIWVAEQKQCDITDRKIGAALLDKKDCAQWIKDWNAFKMMEDAA